VSLFQEKHSPTNVGPPRGDTRHLLNYMVQGEDNRGRRTNNPAGLHPILSAPSSPSTLQFLRRIPFLPHHPN